MTEQTKSKYARRSLNVLGKFFARVRIDIEMTQTEWAKHLGVSNLVISSIERGDGKLTSDLAVKINELLEVRAPEYVSEFAAYVAQELRILLIPSFASMNAVEAAYQTLHYLDKQIEADEQQNVPEQFEGQ